VSSSLLSHKITQVPRLLFLSFFLVLSLSFSFSLVYKKKSLGRGFLSFAFLFLLVWFSFFEVKRKRAGRCGGFRLSLANLTTLERSKRRRPVCALPSFYGRDFRSQAVAVETNAGPCLSFLPSLYGRDNFRAKYSARLNPRGSGVISATLPLSLAPVLCVP